MKTLLLTLILFTGAYAQDLKNFEYVGTVPDGAAGLDVGVDFKTAKVTKGVAVFWAIYANDPKNYSIVQISGDCVTKKYVLREVYDVTEGVRTHEVFEKPEERNPHPDSANAAIINMVCVGGVGKKGLQMFSL